MVAFLLVPLVASFGVHQPLPTRVRTAPRAAPTMVLGGWGSKRNLKRPDTRCNTWNRLFGKRPGNFGKGGFLGIKPPQPPAKPPKATVTGGEEPPAEPTEDEATGPWAAYERALETNPILVKGATSFVGFTLGDILAQCFVEKKGPYDPIRTLRLASFGFLIHGTTSHWFYGKLDNAIPGKGGPQVASKVFIDQVLWNPIFGIMFFGYMGIFEGSGIAGTITKIKRDLITQVTGSWTVWPLAHAINFRYIPTDQRVLYINVIQVFYNCFLSIVGNKKVETA